MDNIVGFERAISPQEHPFHPRKKGVLAGKSRNESLNMIDECLMKWMLSDVSTMYLAHTDYSAKAQMQLVLLD